MNWRKLANAIRLEPGLTRNTWCDAEGLYCAAGCIMRGCRYIDSFSLMGHLGATHQELREILYENDLFNGTPGARRDYMLTWAEKKAEEYGQ